MGILPSSCPLITFPTHTLLSHVSSQDSTSQTSVVSGLESLPTEVLTLICRQLDLSSRICLAFTNKSLARALSSLPAILVLQLEDYRAQISGPIYYNETFANWDLRTRYSTAYVDYLAPVFRRYDVLTSFNFLCTICVDTYHPKRVLIDPSTNRGRRHMYIHTRNHALHHNKDSMFTLGLFRLLLCYLQEQKSKELVKDLRECLVYWILDLHDLD